MNKGYVLLELQLTLPQIVTNGEVVKELFTLYKNCIHYGGEKGLHIASHCLQVITITITNLSFSYHFLSFSFFYFL